MTCDHVQAIQKIPGFWLSVFQNHETLGSLLEEVDLEILHAMKELEVVLAEITKYRPYIKHCSAIP